MRTIYLAGPINGCTDDECNGWRDRVIRSLSDRFQFSNPMSRDYRGREDQGVTEIVEGDLADIKAADIVLVNAGRSSWGTAMEVRAAAHEMGKPVHVICPDPVSPWLRYHAAAVHASLDDAIQALRFV